MGNTTEWGTNTNISKLLVTETLRENTKAGYWQSAEGAWHRGAPAMLLHGPTSPSKTTINRKGRD